MLKKMNIYRRFLLYLLSAGLLSFLALSAVFLWSLYDANQKAVQNGRDMGTAVETTIAGMDAYFAKQQLLLFAQGKAQFMDSELRTFGADTQHIAMEMERLLSAAGQYRPRELKRAGTQPVMPGEACIYYSPEIRSQEAENALRGEIGIASGIADILENTAGFYAAEGCEGWFAVASEKGYYITVNISPRYREYVEFSPEFLAGYVPKDAPWYRDAAGTGKLAISDAFVDKNRGLPFLSISMPYRDGEGFAGVATISLSVQSMYEFIVNSTRGGSGISFAVNGKGDVMLSSLSGRQDSPQDREAMLAAAARSVLSSKSQAVKTSLNGENYYLASVPLPSVGWKFVTMVKEAQTASAAREARSRVEAQKEAFASAMDAFFRDKLREMALLLPVILAILALLSRMEAKRFSRPVLALTDGVKTIAEGNLDHRLEIRTGDEIEAFSDSVNRMTADLKEYMAAVSAAAAEKQSIATELSLAQEIQEGLLPRVFPQASDSNRFELFATMEAAKIVGGDFYDFYLLDEQHLAVTIADVSDKGIPAALFMMCSKTILKNIALTGVGAMGYDAVMNLANRQLCEDNDEMMFVTVFFGVLDLETGELAYVNAGHNPPLLCHGGEFTYLRMEQKSSMLGAVEDEVYLEHRLTLAPGDMLFLYTDGVTEAMDAQGKQYSERRLCETLNACKEKNVKEILACVREDMAAHVGEAEQSDDITMLGVRFLGV